MFVILFEHTILKTLEFKIAEYFALKYLIMSYTFDGILVKLIISSD